MDLSQIRKEIDDIDSQLLPLSSGGCAARNRWPK